jgi:serine phosphatase RsbU (regulator of sigma subunit)
MDENSSLSSATIVDVDERVLVMPASVASGERISRILAAREMVTEILATSSAADYSSMNENYELVILELVGSIEENIELLRLINLNSRFTTIPQLVIAERPDDLKRVTPPLFNKRTTLLSAPLDPKQLLLQVSAAIRDSKVDRESMGRVVSVSSRNAELREITRRFKKDLEEAEKVQASILPKKLPSAEGVRLAATYIPLDGVGGDLYDVWRRDDGRIGAFVGDVTGHGLPAALIGALTKMALSFSTQDEPNKALAGINSALCPLIPDERFVTAVMAFLDGKSGKLQVGRAGHPPALLYRSESESAEELLAKGPPLGFTDVAAFSLFEVELKPGDKVMFYTDGLTECSSMEGEMLGTEGLKRMMVELAPELSAGELTGAILDYIDSYRGDRALKDDITIVILEKL